MPTLDLALDPSGPKRLRIAWGAFFRNCTVTLDGQLLGTFPTKADLERGGTYPLADGGQLGVRLQKSAFGTQIEVTRNGHPLPGSPTHPGSRIRDAALVFYFVATMTTLFGIAQAAMGSDATAIGSGVGTAVEGLLFLGLGILTHRRHRWALITGTVLYVGESLFTFASLAGASGAYATGGGGGIIMRVLFAAVLIRGILAFRDLGKLDPNQAAAAFR